MPRKKAELKGELINETVAEELLNNNSAVLSANDLVNPDKSPENYPEEKKESKPQAATQKRTRYHNEVVLRGEIMKLIEAPKVTIITVRTRATATISNYPTVMFFGAAKENAKGYKEGERVEIKASITSYDVSKLQKHQSDVLLTGQTISREPELFESPERDGAKPIEPVCFNDFNMIDLSGQILAIECDKNNDISLTIRTFSNSRISVVKYPYYAREIGRFLKNIHVHQYIRAIGTVQTAQIPIDPIEEQAAEKASPLSENAPRPSKIRTRKKQFYILYDIYPN